MSSEEEPELPVAAVWRKKQDSITVILGEADNQYDYKVQTLNQEVQMVTNVDEEEIGDGTELVRKSDAEEAIAKERSRSYDEGFFEGRQSREEEILDKLYKQLTNYREKSEDIGLSDREIGACEELRTLQRNLRNDLKEEVDES